MSIKKLIVTSIKNKISLLLVVFCFFVTDATSAPIFTIDMRQQMPVTIKVNQDGLAVYTLTNHAPISAPGITIAITNPAVHLRLGMGGCNFPLTLNPKETCQFILDFSSSVVGATFNDWNDVIIQPPGMPSMHIAAAPGHTTTVVN